MGEDSEKQGTETGAVVLYDLVQLQQAVEGLESASNDTARADLAREFAAKLRQLLAPPASGHNNMYWLDPDANRDLAEIVSRALTVSRSHPTLVFDYRGPFEPYIREVADRLLIRRPPVALLDELLKHERSLFGDGGMRFPFVNDAVRAYVAEEVKKSETAEALAFADDLAGALDAASGDFAIPDLPPVEVTSLSAEELAPMGETPGEKEIWLGPVFGRDSLDDDNERPLYIGRVYSGLVRFLPEGHEDKATDPRAVLAVFKRLEDRLRAAFEECSGDHVRFRVTSNDLVQHEFVAAPDIYWASPLVTARMLRAYEEAVRGGTLDQAAQAEDDSDSAALKEVRRLNGILEETYAACLGALSESNPIVTMSEEAAKRHLLGLLVTQFTQEATLTPNPYGRIVIKYTTPDAAEPTCLVETF